MLPLLAATDPLKHALIYLLAAVIAVPVAKRLGLGSVLGYLVAGALIGPACLGFVGDTNDVMHFAEFGVVMMLFLVGLELQPRMLWRMRGPVVGLGGLQVIATAAALMAAALALGQTWRPALAIGCALALSSTAIVLQSLDEKSLAKTNGGRKTFAILLFQDLAVIPMLALMPLLAPPGTLVDDDGGPLGTLPAWLQGVATLGAIAAVIVGGRLLARPLLRAVAATGLRELFTATALLLVVGISVAMTSVGLSPALGTFLAGVVLADNEYRHELESDIEPFKGLLLGLFFITIGAGIDFHRIASAPLTIAGLVLGLIALKSAVLFGLGALFKLGPPARWLVGLSLAQGGEFAFVLFATMSTSEVLTPDLTQRLTVVVALSMAATPLLLILHDRILRARLGTQPDETPSDDPSGHQAPVVIAGFGRHGQIVGRLLRANGIGTTVLDLDPISIEACRKHGMTVFYGDAARVELLDASGCADAKLFVLAVDDTERSEAITRAVRTHFPHLPIVARAKTARHAHLLHCLGVTETTCEATAGGLGLGQAALRCLGFGAFRAERAVRRFRRHEAQTQAQLFEAWGDDAAELQIARARVADLDRLLDADDEAEALNMERSWDAAPAAQAARDEEPAP